MSKCKSPPPGWRWVFTPYITKSGRRVWAKQFGKKCFAFLVPDEEAKGTQQPRA